MSGPDRHPLPRLHAVTDERVARRPDLTSRATELAVGGGSRLALHARGRTLSGREHYQLAVRLSGVPGPQLFVNERLDVALATHASGVQLGRGALSPVDARRLHGGWWIGVSVHNVTDARAAQRAGADYLVVGPVFDTASHPASPALGPGPLVEFVRIGLPVVAIGGITPHNVHAIRDAGAYGLAVIRALWDAQDPARVARDLLDGLGAQ